MEHLTECNILFARQFGFRKRHSTSDAIITFLGDILQAFDNDSMVLSLFIDLKKAFDTVSHTVILKKLSLYGIREHEYKWFHSYLSNRRQAVSLENNLSDVKDVNVGVPQGSLLGVLLFQIHINDVFKSLKYCSAILYADDTTIYLVGKSVRFLRIKLQFDLNNLATWLRMNQLKLNTSKSKVMLLNRGGLNPEIALDLDGDLLENVSFYKFLGVTIDSALTFEEHFAQCHAKLLKSSVIIRLLSRYLPTECLRTLYFAYFHSHLTYCLLAWYPLLSKRNQNALFILQKRLVRAINNAPYTQHCMPLFKKCKIATIQDHLKIENVKLMYRIVNDLSPNPVIKLYRIINSQSRSSGVSSIPHSTALVNRSFMNKPVMDWQEVPFKCKQKSNIESFGKAMRDLYLEKY